MDFGSRTTVGVVAIGLLLSGAACSSGGSTGAGAAGQAGDGGGTGTGGTGTGGTGTGGTGTGGTGTGGTAGTGTGGAASRGFIQIDPQYPHSFEYQDGERYFPMGDTSYGLISEPKSTIRDYIDSRSKHGFNFIRFPALQSYPGQTDPFWPFGGTPGSPDFSVVSDTVMAKLDWVFDYAASRGMNIELIIWGYGDVGGDGMWGNAQEEDAWVDYLVNRYKDRTNLFMWTVTNEYERYPDDVYSYAASDTTWAQRIASRIRGLDPIHAIGVHSPAGQDSDKLITWDLWENSAVNVLNVFTRSGFMNSSWVNQCPTGYAGVLVQDTTWNGRLYPATWTGLGWDYEAPGIDVGLAEDWSHGKPVVVTEFGYQTASDAGPGDQNWRSCQLYTQNMLRKNEWKITTSGAFLAAGFLHTVKSIDDSKIDVWNPEQLGYLYDFYTQRTQYWKMGPRPDLIGDGASLLALPGSEYVAYLVRGGTSTITLAAGTYDVEWLNPETGETTSAGVLVAGDGNHDFTPPSDTTHDWVLHLKKTGG